MSEKMLEVKNLKISFRTQGGTVKAVRDISFDIERGETLAIVGESGSGKSVTSKAILGILAGNSIIEGGEILYDGKDLLRISEEDMHKIRGDKIAMIFQDPLSSLNPIVKIGRQITEAMLLKNKATRKMSRKEFNSLLAILQENMICVLDASSHAKVKSFISLFDKFNVEGIKLEEKYNIALGNATALFGEVDDLIFHIEYKREYNIGSALSSISKKLPTVKDIFLTAGHDAAVDNFASKIAELKKAGDDKGQMLSVLKELKEFLNMLSAKVRPDFASIGYYKLDDPSADLTALSIEELNIKARACLDEKFMNEFLEMVSAALSCSAGKAIEAKKAALSELAKARTYFEGEITKSGATRISKELNPKITACIDKLDIIKDSATYTFKTSFNGAIDKYFKAIVNNPKEEARFARQSAKREALIKRGRRVDWKVVPKNVYDLAELRANIVALLDNLSAKYSKDIEGFASVDMQAKALALIDYLKEKASEVVFRLTKRMAKEKAIKLMDEVGIPESRIRYNQYPFQFSGGMRQRIVIAIALSANPDVLICDEPTTALDVTIQAQILELINNLKRERNLSVIFITHDLGVVANIADKIGVMYAGKIVEYGTADDIFYDPRHPYTWALLSSMPDLDTSEKLEAIPGTPPNMIYPPVGDAFADRNKYALEIDFEMQPPQFAVSPTHWAATWLLHPDAPKVEPPHIIVDRIERMTKQGGADNG